tara:strand:- start:409 stop:735 length:327 start_codon:yes stop_codon:yes gene_type:complete
MSSEEKAKLLMDSLDKLILSDPHGDIGFKANLDNGIFVSIQWHMYSHSSNDENGNVVSVEMSCTKRSLRIGHWMSRDVWPDKVNKYYDILSFVPLAEVVDLLTIAIDY